MSRVFLTVLDAVGAGEAPDAADYGDVGTNTLGHVIEKCDPQLPHMAALGLGKIPGTGYVRPGYGTEQGKGYYVRALGDRRRAGGETVPHIPERLSGVLYGSI